MAKVKVSKIFGLVLIDQIKIVLYFPVWWYSLGFFKALKGTWEFVKDFEQTLGFSIWLKNLFVPIFGQRDIAGRIISFFLRLFEIVLRGFALLIFVIVALVFIIFWLILPIFVIYQIIIHF